MAQIVETIQLPLYPDAGGAKQLQKLTEKYSVVCNAISQWIFDNNPILTLPEINKELYYKLRDEFKMKSQLTQSCMKTVIARYKTVRDQLRKNPFKYQDEAGEWQTIQKDLTWLYNPVHFSKSQADLVRGGDYSFVRGGTMLSLNTLEKKRLKVAFKTPEHFKDYFDGTWKFGTGKLICKNDRWYFYIPMSKEAEKEFSNETFKHVVGIDRGLRFMMVTVDETDKSGFVNGESIMAKREHYADVRAQLQSKGTRSAIRRLKSMSGRENRWMTDVNHCMSKALVNTYGEDTLFVLEDLTGVSFDDNLKGRGAKGRRQLRSWAFYQLGEFVTYKSLAKGSKVIQVSPQYTSQRCPKCGRVRKENRDHEKHEYVCDVCGYHNNDDLVGALNLRMLGEKYLAGMEEPCITKDGQVIDKKASKSDEQKSGTAKSSKKTSIPKSTKKSETAKSTKKTGATKGKKKSGTTTKSRKTPATK